MYAKHIYTSSIILIYSRLYILVSKSDLRIGKILVALLQRKERRSKQRREEERTDMFFFFTLNNSPRISLQS